MLNQVILVGRIVQDLEIKELESGKKTVKITLAIPRSFKNSEGVYDTDFIDCIAFGGIAENTKEYCQKGDLIGVKGRVQKLGNEETMKIVAEKITFLATRKQ